MTILFWFLLIAILIVQILIFAQLVKPRNLETEIQVQILQELREIREKLS